MSFAEYLWSKIKYEGEVEVEYYSTLRGIVQRPIGLGQAYRCLRKASPHPRPPPIRGEKFRNEEAEDEEANWMVRRPRYEEGWPGYAILGREP